MAALLELSDITKVYPGVVALDDVSFAIAPGEVVGLIGENGAGKSTLMKVLGGLTPPTQGMISIDGEERHRFSVQDSLTAGIAFVHQELNLFDNLDVAANVYLGREMRSGRLRLVDNKAMARAVEPILDMLGVSFGPATPVASLSLAERQLLEIAKALSLESRVVIMDEPTSSLTLSETVRLLKIIEDLKGRGIAVIFISHRLSEVEECADRVVALRDGKVAGHLGRNDITHDAMIRLMIGRDLKSLYSPPAHPAGCAVLSFSGVRTDAHPDAAVDLDVRSGEILGMAGLVGAGRTELAHAAFGIDVALGGEISVAGTVLADHRPDEAIAAGLYLVPEDRKDAGLIIEFPIVDNVTLASLDTVSARGLIRRKSEVAVAEAQRQRLAIKSPDVFRAAAEMSGGNQQKVVLAKWLSMKPKAIIFDEPTRGIDVGSKNEIYRLMRDLADAGVAILMISSDMEEVIGVSDRIAVIHEGSVSGVLDRDAFSEHNVLTLAIGKSLEEA